MAPSLREAPLFNSVLIILILSRSIDGFHFRKSENNFGKLTPELPTVIKENCYCPEGCYKDPDTPFQTRCCKDLCDDDANKPVVVRGKCLQLCPKYAYIAPLKKEVNASTVYPRVSGSE